MDILTRRDAEQLIAKRDESCISIYIPTHRAGQEIQQDAIRLKNSLKRAEDRLLEDGWRLPDVKDLLEPAQQLLSDDGFWRHQSDGLAVFLSSEGGIHYRLPQDFEELIVTADHFHVKPLLPLLNGDEQFYILALSQSEVKLLVATPYTVREIDLGDSPTSLDEALRWDDPESQLQFHSSTASPGGKGERPSAFHGQGVGVDTENADVRRFFHRVDEGVRAIVEDENVPMVIVGVEEILPIYREVNEYPNLVKEGILHNPDPLSADALRQKVLPLVKPMFTAKKEEAANKYLSLAGSNSERASDDLEAVIWAAYGGRVESLFVPQGVQRWGKIDPSVGKIQRQETPIAGFRDLLDIAAAHTFLNKGDVYVVAREDVPGDGLLAAVLRY